MPNPVHEEDVKKQKIELQEIGPCFDLRIRRKNLASTDLYKDACRQPKTRNIEKNKADKNKFTTALGETKGKVFIQAPDLDTIALKKYRKVDLKARVEDV